MITSMQKVNNLLKVSDYIFSIVYKIVKMVKSYTKLGYSALW